MKLDKEFFEDCQSFFVKAVLIIGAFMITGWVLNFLDEKHLGGYVAVAAIGWVLGFVTGARKGRSEAASRE